MTNKRVTFEELYEKSQRTLEVFGIIVSFLLIGALNFASVGIDIVQVTGKNIPILIPTITLLFFGSSFGLLLMSFTISSYAINWGFEKYKPLELAKNFYTVSIILMTLSIIILFGKIFTNVMYWSEIIPQFKETFSLIDLLL